MPNDCGPAIDARSAPRWLMATAALLMAVMAAALVWNAATTSIWEDEANGYFLSRQPAGEMLGLMADNIHEDPPLFDLVMNGWIRVAGRDVLLLRGLSIGFWMLMLPGLFLSARVLAGRSAAWTTLAIAAVMPVGWLFPVSMRWYSFYTCLCVWNFYFFLRLGSGTFEGGSAAGRFARGALRTTPYWLSGAALWYTNYSAPVLFFAHLLIAAGRRGPKRPVLVELVGSWLMIGLLYSPWLPTFFSQLGASPHPFSATATAMGVWVLVAGELSTPLAPGMAIAVACLAATLVILTAAGWRACWVPAVMIAVVLLAMSLTGVLWTKRILFLAPFVAMTAAFLVCRAGTTPRWFPAARVGLVGLMMLVSGLSLANMVRRADWLSYRWLDPCREAVERVERQSPGAVIVTNSNPVLFYLGDRWGKAFHDRSTGGRAAGIHYPSDHRPEYYEPLCRADRAAYIYQAAYGGPISSGYDELLQWMRGYGFRPVGSEGLLEAPETYLRRHPRFRGRMAGPLDRQRVVIVHFAKERLAASGGPSTAAAVR